MDSISSRVNKVAPSLTLSVTNQAKAMKARGEEVYGLAGGEPDQDTPDFIKQAAIQALNEGKTKYTPASGIPELREAIASKLMTDNGVEYDPRQIVVNSGAKRSAIQRWFVLQVLSLFLSKRQRKTTGRLLLSSSRKT